MEITQTTVDCSFHNLMQALRVLGTAYPAAEYEKGVFNVATHITDAGYTGGMWELQILSNGGFYMSPRNKLETYKCFNRAAMWEGELAGDAFGIAVNLYVSSHLSFQLYDDGVMDAAQAVSDNYHLIREYFLQDNSPFEDATITKIAMCCD